MSIDMTVERAAAECAVIDAARTLERCAQYGHRTAAAHRDLDEAIERKSQLVRAELAVAS